MSPRAVLKAAYFAALQTAGLEGYLVRRLDKPDTALVLNLHRVTPVRNPYWPPMAPRQFERLLVFLRRSFDVVSFANLAQPYQGRPRVVLSFDDGCRDFLEYAMPILDAHGLRVNHNVVVESVDQGTTPWMIKLVDALNVTPVAHVRRLRTPGLDLRLERDDDQAKAIFGARLTAYLKRMNASVRASRCADLEQLIADTDPVNFTAMMSRSEVQSITTIHELGAHSVDHETLSILSDAEFEAQVERCASFMAGLGVPMRIFAFPYGMYAPGQIEALLRHGVEHVLLVEEAPTRLGSGVYARITMYGETDAELRLRALGHRPA